MKNYIRNQSNKFPMEMKGYNISNLIKLKDKGYNLQWKPQPMFQMESSLNPYYVQ